MMRIFKLLVMGSLVAYVAARLRRRTRPSTHTEAPEFRGISDVDPGPLTQFGEGIDPEAVRDAHEVPALHRDQLPRPGKNLP